MRSVAWIGVPKEEKDFWDKLAIALRPLQAVSLALVGFLLTGSVNNALKRQELDLQAIRGMRETLAVFETPGASEEQLRAAALTLTVFGERAVQPLVTQLDASGTSKAVAAIQGLRVLGGTEPALVCESLTTSLDQSVLHSVFTLNDAVELVRLLRCKDARRALFALRAAARGEPAEAMKNLEGRVADSPPPTPPAVKDLQDRLDAAITALGG